MPTGPKLIAGICLALTVAATVILLGMTHRDVAIGTMFLAAAVLLGFAVGWRVLGNSATGISDAFFGTLRSGIYLFLGTALVLGAADFNRAMGRVVFRDLMEPILFWLEASLSLAGLMVQPQIIGVFAAGLVVSWIATWIIGRSTR